MLNHIESLLSRSRLKVFKEGSSPVGKHSYELEFINDDNSIVLETIINFLNKDLNTNIKQLSANSFSIEEQDFIVLKKTIRQYSKSVKPDKDFIIELEVNPYELNRLLESIILFNNKKNFPQKQFKRELTITANGVFRRKDFPDNDPRQTLPLKVSQYTKQEKQGFSSLQSASLRLVDSSTPGHLTGVNFGILLAEEDFLYSNHNYISSSDNNFTASKFWTLQDAEKAYKEAVEEKSLFAADQIADMKKLISDKSEAKKNIVRGRMRWNLHTSKVYIGDSDSLSTRIRVQRFAIEIKNYLITNNACTNDYNVPICYFTPGNLDLHFKEYTLAEQILDRVEASSKIWNDMKINTSYHHFLPVLPSREILKKLVNLELFEHILRDDPHLLTFLNKVTGNNSVYKLLAKLNFSHHALARCFVRAYIEDNEQIVALILTQAPLSTLLTYCDLISVAVKKNDINFVREILKLKQSNKSLEQIRINDSILIAAKNGYLEIMRELLQAGADVNTIEPSPLEEIYGDSALHLAAANGDVDMVKLLIENKADVKRKRKNYDENSPLHLAARYGHFEVVRILIENKADVKQENRERETPLDFATQNDHLQVVKILAVAATDIDQFILRNDGDSLFCWASRYGHSEIINFLIQKKIGIKKKNKYGEIAIVIAAVEGHLDVVKTLIENKEDVNQKDRDGYFPLFVAAAKGHLDVLKILIENKADVNQKYSYGQQHCYGDSPLHIAANKGKPDAVQILIDNKADVKAVNKYGNIPLDLAISNGHLQTVKVLILAMTEIDQFTLRDGDSVFLWASRNGHSEILNLLMKMKVNIKQVDRSGKTAIYIAAEQGYVEIVKILIENKVDVNEIPYYGYPPLFAAIQSDNLEIIKLLIEGGADVNLFSPFIDASPLFLASIKGNPEVVKLLIEKGADFKKAYSSVYAIWREEFHPNIASETGDLESLIIPNLRSNHIEDKVLYADIEQFLVRNKIGDTFLFADIKKFLVNIWHLQKDINAQYNIVLSYELLEKIKHPAESFINRKVALIKTIIRLDNLIFEIKKYEDQQKLLEDQQKLLEELSNDESNELPPQPPQIEMVDASKAISQSKSNLFLYKSEDNELLELKNTLQKKINFAKFKITQIIKAKISKTKVQKNIASVCVESVEVTNGYHQNRVKEIQKQERYKNSTKFFKKDSDVVVNKNTSNSSEKKSDVVVNEDKTNSSEKEINEFVSEINGYHQNKIKEIHEQERQKNRIFK